MLLALNSSAPKTSPSPPSAPKALEKCRNEGGLSAKAAEVQDIFGIVNGVKYSIRIMFSQFDFGSSRRGKLHKPLEIQVC